MCGIAGYIGSQRIDDARIAATLERMRARGPDHQCHTRIDADGTQALLLHSRLSIIDLDPRANQPMTRDGCTLVFNGEIYNYRELRRDLEARGFAFQTDSDSEVLLASYLAHGAECVRWFEGMWALAIYDARTRSLLLSRDRFGEKPLYLLDTPDGLYFGSEIKLLTALSGRRLTVNGRHIARFLVNGYKSLYKTDGEFFEGVRRLSAATNLRIDSAGRRCEQRYWRPPDASF
ncbi:MAG: asparagine synthase (glutamine-hydrolyzing), partial [Planctomycetota bacterium]